jgi:hypothetical protein
VGACPLPPAPFYLVRFHRLGGGGAFQAPKYLLHLLPAAAVSDKGVAFCWRARKPASHPRVGGDPEPELALEGPLRMGPAMPGFVGD